MVLRILTYNIHGLPWINCPMKSILMWIRWKADPDIICLQELFSKGLQEKVELYAPFLGYRVYNPEHHTCFGKTYMKFHSPSGLCILVKNGIPICDEPYFEAFDDASGVDRLVKKGIFVVSVVYKGKRFDILNTHFQSDFTELPCYRLRYDATRMAQELQLAKLCKKYSLPFILGDFNQSRFTFLKKFDTEYHVTFPSTFEHLDHAVFRNEQRDLFKKIFVEYYDDCNLSDHIPVLYGVELSQI